mgnify:CR=1 FL=1
MKAADEREVELTAENGEEKKVFQMGRRKTDRNFFEVLSVLCSDS